MLTVVVNSTNPVKVQSTLEGFRRMFPGEEIRVDIVSTHSGVSHQPTSNAETLLGAARVNPAADYSVGSKEVWRSKMVIWRHLPG